MVEYGQEIKEAADKVQQAADPAQAIQALKETLVRCVELTFDRLDKLSPFVAENGKQMLAEAQDYVVHIAEGVEAAFNAIGRSPGPNGQSANRMAELVSLTKDTEIVAAVKRFLRNDKT